MDRRTSLVLVLSFAAALFGCAPHGPLPLVSSETKSAPAPPPPPPPAAEPAPVSEARPHKPHASTYVAAGSLAEKTAEDPKRGPADRENMLEQARKAYQQAIATEPDYLPAYQGLARLYIKLGDHDHAVATLQKVLQTHPKEAPLWFDLGMCYSRHKQWEPALDCLRKAVDLDPESRPYINTLGFCLARAGKLDESLACFQKIGGPAQAHYNLARMLHHLGQDEPSKQHLQLALQADPKLDAARQLLSHLDGRPTGVVQMSAAEPIDDEDAEEDEHPAR
jgi:Tfp pilus assembly protein PilF